MLRVPPSAGRGDSRERRHRHGLSGAPPARRSRPQRRTMVPIPPRPSSLRIVAVPGIPWETVPPIARNLTAATGGPGRLQSRSIRRSHPSPHPACGGMPPLPARQGGACKSLQEAGRGRNSPLPCLAGQGEGVPRRKLESAITATLHSPWEDSGHAGTWRDNRPAHRRQLETRDVE